MGIQSFKFPVDFLNNLEHPVIYIANKYKEILNAVAIYDGLKLTCNLNAFQTAEFKIYRDINGEKQDYFKDFEEGMLIMIPGIAWYEIHVETNIDNTGISKTISATSLECKLCDKRLVDFQVNSDDFEDDDYVVTTFYNPTDPKKSLLDRALNITPNWSVGHVDQSLVDKQRTFNEDDVNVYSFLTETAAEAFNCLFIFDTFNQTVNAYDLDNYGNDTNIFVSMDNLAQNMTETIDQRSIYTCYRVKGGDGVFINEVNPNGTDKIYDFSYYLSQMPEELQQKLLNYNNAYQILMPIYEEVVAAVQEQLEKIYELLDRVPDSLASTDWTQYGLALLQSQEKSLITQEELYCAQGYNIPADIHYDLYKQNHQKLVGVQSEIAVREAEIESARNEYEETCEGLTALQDVFDMDNWFTEDEWLILDDYVIEETYSNDNFSVVDNTNEAELFSMEKELFDKACEDLSKKCRPQYQYSATLANLLTIPEFKDFVKYFELGNFIRMETDYDSIVKLRLISFTVDYNNTGTIDVTFSDAVRVKDVYEDTASILGQASSLASSFKFRKDQYDNSVKQGNFVAEMRKYGLDVATTQIYNATDQSQTWDSTGMTFRKWNDERQDYDPEMIKIINNMMVFLDGENGARMAIGKLKLPNGSETYGINCEILMNKLTMSQNVWIENDSGTYKFDDDGFNASNGTNTVKIQPGNSGEMFSIYKGSDKQFYITSSGDVEYAGTLRGATGIFSGLLQGGSINIGNNTFTVDENGNMRATSGFFMGEVYCTNGKIGGWNIGVDSIYKNGMELNSSGTIKSIDVSDPNFYTLISNGTVSIKHNDSIMNLGKGLTFSGAARTTNIYSNGIHTPELTTTLINNSGYGDLTIDVSELKIKGKTTFANPISLPSRYGSLAGTTDKIVYKTTSGGYEDIPSVGWVTGYVSKKIPDTSKFATKSDLNGYSPSGHTHSNYIIKFSGDGSSGVYNSIYTSGQVIYGSKISYSDLKNKVSDVRVKYDIHDVENISSLYMNLKPVQYRYKKGVGDDEKNQFGVVAQWTRDVMSQNGLDVNDYSIVRKSKPLPDTKEKYYVDDDILRIDYEQFHALHISMIQKHEREIEELKRENIDLKQEVTDLKQLVNKLLERDSV